MFRTVRTNVLSANVNSRSRSLYAVACPSVVCLSVVCNARAPYSVGFRQCFCAVLVTWPSVDIHGKFYGDRHSGTPPSEELNAGELAKYSDFGPIEGCILETVQDRR